MTSYYPAWSKEYFKDWKLIRETSGSQLWKVESYEEQMLVDIHFTTGAQLAVHIDSTSSLSKNKLDPLFDYCVLLSQGHGEYAIINYTFIKDNEIIEGHWSIPITC